MTGGVPEIAGPHDDDRSADPTSRGPAPRSGGTVVLWRVLFVTLVAVAVAVAIASLFYGGLPQDG